MALRACCRSQAHLPLHPCELAVHLSKLLLLLHQAPAQSQQLDTRHPACKHESGMSEVHTGMKAGGVVGISQACEAAPCCFAA